MTAGLDFTMLAAMRPPMPTSWDVDRATKQQARLQILDEDWEKLLSDWMACHVSPERLAAWGPPDTSSNALANICRQLTTPGLYGTRPELRHTDPAAGPLIGHQGALDRSGLWTLMQWVQYLAIGMGDYIVCHDVDPATGEITHRPVNPHDVWIACPTSQPDRPVMLWELRLRYVEAWKEWVWAWDKFDLGERTRDAAGTETEVRPPSYAVVCAAGPKKDMDLSNLFLGAAGGLVGTAYPYRKADGTPFLKHVFYRAVDSKRPWNHLYRLGLTRGALNAAKNWTFSGHCAMDASGSTVLVSGMVPIMGDTQHTDGAAPGDGGGPPIQSIQTSPGSIFYHQAVEGSQPFVQEVGPGANLDVVSKYAYQYELRLAIDWGLNPSDILRVSADSSSGAALAIGQSGKREFARQVQPLFLRADLESLAVCAALLSSHTGQRIPETGYSITYAAIPLSAQEETARREEIDWEVENDFLSEIEAYQKLHPGASEDAAMAAIVNARVTKARIEAAVAAKMVELGLVKPVPPAPPEPEKGDPPEGDPPST